MRSAVLCLALLAAVHIAAAAPVKLHLFDTALHKTAVCNDGTPAGFYYRLNRSSTEWIIYLEGGGLCYDRATCEQRSSKLVSSSNWEDTRPLNGLLSASKRVNPLFSTFNVVFLPYCTSDLWTGNVSTNPWGFSFYGSHLRHAVVEDAANPALFPYPNLANATNVLVSGTSAGGIGTVQNVDSYASLLPHARVRGLPDAGWFLPIPLYKDGDPGHVDVETQITLGQALWNGMPQERCARNRAPQDLWQCYFSTVTYEYVASDLFISEAQMDSWSLVNAGVPWPFWLWPGARNYGEEFASAVRDSLKQVSNAFAPNCAYHSAAQKSIAWQSQTVYSVSMRDAVAQWWGGLQTKLIDECIGVNCNPTCLWGLL